MKTYQEFLSFSQEFWAWRSINQATTGDDIPRIERPSDWLPSWKKEFVHDNMAQLKIFQERFAEYKPESWTAFEKTDHALIGSAIARTHWEFGVTANWRRNPVFYVDQAIGPIFDELVVPPAKDGFGEQRSRIIIQKIQNIRQIVDSAIISSSHMQDNLDQAVKSFTELALQDLQDMGQKLIATSEALHDLIPKHHVGELMQATEEAVTALNEFRAYLVEQKDLMLDKVALGKEQYEYFLKNVALIPWDTETILLRAQQALQHCISQEAIECHRCQFESEPPIAASSDVQIKENATWDAKVRQFIKERKLLTIPDWLMAYKNDPIPGEPIHLATVSQPYLAPLASWGCLDDLTSPSRLKEDARRYIPEPSPTIGFFQASAARDPRPVLVHEGVPGHYCQMAMSWAHPNFIRRHFYDSTPNEGIGFYAEELLLQQGFFDDSPHTRKTLYTYMRLRAIRVHVDVKLATGEFSIEEAADYLVQNVPMDRETAMWEAVFFAAIPGQAISYTVGKLQLFDFLYNARLKLGDKFDLQHWHDFVWLNGNVPIALMQQEYLANL